MASTLGATNPFRYRGYYYDTESGWYYLNSRYYDPQVGRFINADGIVGANMFSYGNYFPSVTHGSSASSAHPYYETPRLVRGEGADNRFTTQRHAYPKAETTSEPWDVLEADLFNGRITITALVPLSINRFDSQYAKITLLDGSSIVLDASMDILRVTKKPNDITFRVIKKGNGPSVYVLMKGADELAQVTYAVSCNGNAFKNGGYMPGGCSWRTNPDYVESTMTSCFDPYLYTQLYVKGSDGRLQTFDHTPMHDDEIIDILRRKLP